VTHQGAAFNAAKDDRHTCFSPSFLFYLLCTSIFFLALLTRDVIAGGRDGTKATLTVRMAAGAVLGQLTMTYEADVTGDVVQIHSHQLDAACSSMLSQSLVTPPLLDTLLTSAIFDDAGSSAHSLPPRAFELLFDSAKYVASGNYRPMAFPGGGMGAIAPRIRACPQVAPTFRNTRLVTCYII